jgi:hypothetical protein
VKSEVLLCSVTEKQLGTGDPAPAYVLATLHAPPERLEFGVKGKASSSEIVLVTIIKFVCLTLVTSEIQ